MIEDTEGVRANIPAPPQSTSVTKSDPETFNGNDQTDFSIENLTNLDENLKNQPLGAESQNLSTWFWGTIITLAIATLFATFFANYRLNTSQNENKQPIIQTSLIELLPTELRDKFNSANGEAIDVTSAMVEALVTKAYEPVFEAVPEYVDWHYSVWGSYVELGTGLLGDPVEALNDRLFIGLNQRIDNIPPQLDKIFEENFNKNIAAQFQKISSDGAMLGPLTSKVISDAQKQTGGSVFLFMGGKLLSKNIAKVVSTKIGAKITAKIAAKVGSKWIIALGGGSTGAVMCAWAGPGAAACAVAGALFTWIVADVAIGKLDELINRDDFEQTLRIEIEQIRDEQILSFKNLIFTKAAALNKQTDLIIKDFTLKQLSSSETSQMCSEAVSLVNEYNLVSNNLKDRSSEQLVSLQKAAKMIDTDVAFFELGQEVYRNMENFNNTSTLKLIKISGNVHNDLSKDPDISGSLKINGDKIIIERTEATADNGFNIPLSHELNIENEGKISVKLELEQHLIMFNKYFSGAHTVDFFPLLSGASGLDVTSSIILPISSDTASNGSIYTLALNLSFHVSGEKLPDLKFSPNCERYN
jgi:hypothetical protein